MRYYIKVAFFLCLLPCYNSIQARDSFTIFIAENEIVDLLSKPITLNSGLTIIKVNFYNELNRCNKNSSILPVYQMLKVSDFINVFSCFFENNHINLSSVIPYMFFEKDSMINLLYQKGIYSMWQIYIILIVLVCVLFLSYIRFSNVNYRFNKLYEEQLDLVDERRKITKELLALNIHYESKNNQLKKLRVRLKKNSSLSNEELNEELAKILDNEKDNVLTDWNSVVYKSFVENLRSKSNDTLTSLDFKHCIYILLNISCKEIAEDLNVDTKSIYIARYRIKQKLNLGKNDSLEDFLKMTF